MTVAQVEAPAFLIRKESLNTKAFLVPNAGFSEKVQVRDQKKRLFLAPFPDRADQNRPEVVCGEQNVRKFHAVTRLQVQLRKRKGFLGLVFFAKKNILGRAADIVPACR